MGVGAQGRGETVWVSAVSNDPSLLNMEEVSLGSSVDEISKGSLVDAQKQDQVIGRFVTFLKTKRWPKSWQIKRELPATKVLLRQPSKHYFDEDGLLFRRGGPYSQLVLPQRFHSIVFKELHQEMGHLGAPRVVQLARDISTGPTWKMTSLTLSPKFTHVLNSEGQICPQEHHYTV